MNRQRPFSASTSSLKKIEGLESFEVAQTVITSLRAKRMNKKNYQQYDETDSNNPLINIQDLDSLIQKQKLHHEEFNKNKIKVETLLDQSLVPPSLPSMESPSLYSDNNTINSFEAYNHNESKGRYQPPPTFSSHLDDFDEDSDDDLDSQQKQQRMKANHNHQYQGHLKPSAAPIPAADDFFDADDDDDEGLFSSDFVPPSKTNRSSQNGNSLSSSKINSKSDVAASALKKGIIIKPGQAIRVNSKGLKKTTLT